MRDLAGGSQIRTGTSGANRGGRVVLNASAGVTIQGNPSAAAAAAAVVGAAAAAAAQAPSTASGIFSDVAAAATGSGGAIEITAPVDPHRGSGRGHGRHERRRQRRQHRLCAPASV